MKPYSVILCGAGLRGTAYTNIMKKHPDQFRVIAVAEPDEGRRNFIAAEHGISPENCFSSWEEVLARPKFADLVMICTMDQMHYHPAILAIEKGYHLLLEKPAAQTPEECAHIARLAREKGVKVLVCHVLRYAPFFRQLKQMLMDGAVGKVLSIVHVEAVGNVHQSHSYVRGNWHSTEETTPMLLAKSCHDVDIIQWLLDDRCKQVQSFGSLSYFRRENAPAGAPRSCVDGDCPFRSECHYDCRRLYLEDEKNLWFRRACTKGIAKTEIPTNEEVLMGLRGSDYGLCVFYANNDVVDHQVVNMEFEGGATVSFSMNAFNQGGRYIRIFGTEGELYAHAKDQEITHYSFALRKQTKIPISGADESILSGHGGGDGGMIRELYEYLSDSYSGFCAADIQVSVQNHLIGFAAEESRLKGTVENVPAYLQRYGFQE